MHSRSSGAAFQLQFLRKIKAIFLKISTKHGCNLQVFKAVILGRFYENYVCFFLVCIFFLLSIVAIFQVLPNSGGNGNASTDKWPSLGSTGTNHLLSSAFLGVAISPPKDDKLFNIQYNRSISVGAYKCIQVRCPASHSGLLESEEQEVIAESCLDICIKM